MRGHHIPTIVVIVLGIVAVGGGAAMSYLAMTQTPIPDQLDRYAFGALTALCAILATTRSESVTVDNPPSDPVNTADTAEKRR